MFLEKNKTKHKTGVLDKSATTNNTELRNLPSKIYYLLFKNTTVLLFKALTIL